MTHRVHFAGVPCATLARTYSWRRVVAVEPVDVTCFICLYHMGLYVPLTKLVEHQRYTRMREDNARAWASVFNEHTVLRVSTEPQQ